MFSFDNFICADKSDAQKKLQTILHGGKNKLHLVADFDRTLTKSRNDFGETVTTWAMLARHLPPSAQKEAYELFSKYRPLEIANKLTVETANAWWIENLKILLKNKLKWSDITLDVENKMPMREGVVDLFNLCGSNRIPMVILSAGIKDLIELWCQKHEFKPALILSTDLIFDDQGYLTGWKKESLIHALNKKEKSHAELKKIRQSRPNTILLGDSMDDAAMVDAGPSVLKIMVSEETNREQALTKFDLCVKGDSLLPVVDLVHDIIKI